MKHLTFTLIGVFALCLSIPAVFGGEPPAATPSAHAAEIKISHDWPCYSGPEGTFADPSRVRLLDDLSQARLVWTSEHDDLGYGKTTSGGGHRYGTKSRPSGSCSLIVAGGLVIVTYFVPGNNIVADDVILALDASTGKMNWKQVYAGKGYNRGARKHPSYGPTPAASDGKVFHLGSSGRVYCVELASGTPLWESDLGDYPKHYQGIVAGMKPSDDITDGLNRAPDYKKMRMTVRPLIAIDGVAMVPTDSNGLYAFESSSGKELWVLAGASRTPSPAKIGGKTYALCSGDRNMRLVEPKTGKVLWTQPIGTKFQTNHGFIVADGRAFVPYSKVDTTGGWDTAPLAAFALSETGAKWLWQSQEQAHSETYYAYRDGVIYANVPDKFVKAFKADDGTILSDLDVSNTMSLHGHLHLWGDRLVLVGDDCHESLGGACFYQSCTPGAKDLKMSGRPLAPRTFKSYVGVGGYECWMRPPFADGFLFNRSVDAETGKGVILCWDLRRPSEEELARIRQARERNAGQIVESCRAGRTDPVSAVRELVSLDCGRMAEAFLAQDMKQAVGVADVKRFGALAAAANLLGVEVSASLGPIVNEALASDRRDLALAAMNATGILAGAEAEKAKPVLWAFLRGRNAGAWQQAAIVLRSMDASADGSIVREMSRLSNEDGAALITTAVSVLGVVAGTTPDTGAKKAAIDALVRHLDCKHLEIQKAAIERLAALGPAAAAARKKLDELVELPDLQEAAAKALDRIDPARVKKAAEPGLDIPPLDP